MSKLASMFRLSGQQQQALQSGPPASSPGDHEQRQDLKEFIFIPFTETLFNNDQFSDVTLQVHCDGRLVDTFRCHKFILGSQSALFRDMFEQTDTGDDVITVNEDSEDQATHFHQFLYFMYAGRVTLGPVSVTLTYHLASKYRVGRLLRLVQDYVLLHLCNTETAHTAAPAPWQNAGDAPERGVLLPLSTVIWLAEHARDDVIRRAVTANLQSRLDLLLNSVHWETLHDEELVTALVDDGMVSNEYHLYDRLLQWLEEDRHKHLAEQLLSMVRYALMTHDQVYSVLRHPMVSGNPNLLDHLNRAIQWYYFRDMPVAKKEFTGKLFAPRVAPVLTVLKSSAAAEGTQTAQSQADSQPAKSRSDSQTEGRGRAKTEPEKTDDQLQVLNNTSKAVV